jgi:hypothetical protein
MVPDRTNKMCRKRGTNALGRINGMKGRWIREEDVKLTEAVKKHGTHWVVVAAQVPGRTNDQCRARWTQTLDPTNGKKTGKWALREDAKLTEAVKKHGNDWLSVAAMVPGRTNQQCMSRWTKTLDPAYWMKDKWTPALDSIYGKIAGKWTPAEDARLTEALKRHGKDWVSIAAMVPSRTNGRLVNDGSTVWIQTAPRTQWGEKTTTAMTKRLTWYQYD